ncbi:hypothetical protein L6164_036010 [Bauhinia variegata]|uniref:Uncharacterized protein n=1 Tax=Bauhinia variegata TaxID=167791 RepID=A0ACB9KFP1_BAUVA|nr:hypothetical protein L6164_036010 [Bauhinia variegata]
MEELPERTEWRRIQREQERERRRVRDRQRRQSMTQEQRERHLARRRRNYQLRRERAANARFCPQSLEYSTGEASTSEEHQMVTKTCSTSDYRPLYNNLPHHALNQGQERLNLETNNIDVQQIGSSVHVEALTYTASNLPKRLRLNHIRHLARNLKHVIGDSTSKDQLAAGLIAKEEVSVNGNRPNTLRLNRVKRIARSINSASKQTLVPNPNGTLEVEQNLQQEVNKSIGDEIQSNIASNVLT